MLHQMITFFTGKNDQNELVPDLESYLRQIECRHLNSSEERRLQELQILIRSFWEPYWKENISLETPDMEYFLG